MGGEEGDELCPRAAVFRDRTKAAATTTIIVSIINNNNEAGKIIEEEEKMPIYAMSIITNYHYYTITYLKTLIP